MDRRPARIRALLLLRIAAWSTAAATSAYGLSPAQLAERQSLERTLEDYPAHEKLWHARRDRVLTYTVRQSTSELIQSAPCGGIPIAVRIVDGELRQATYAASAGPCRIGSPAKSTGLYLTPSELFKRIRQARKQLKCYVSDSPSCLPTALKVTYDEASGLPIHMEDYSEDLSDYSWELTITDLKTTQ